MFWLAQEQLSSVLEANAKDYCISQNWIILDEKKRNVVPLRTLDRPIITPWIDRWAQWNRVPPSPCFCLRMDTDPISEMLC
jgi:hypothetical protein